MNRMSEEALSFVPFICCFCFTEKSRTGMVTASLGVSMTRAGEYEGVAGSDEEPVYDIQVLLYTAHSSRMMRIASSY
jgi:hypothetical protein